MRIITILLLLSFIYACRATKQLTICNPQPLSLASLREKYNIISIDSIEHAYVIRAKKDTALYKIVSKKDSNACKTIRVGEEYPLVLNPLTLKEFKGRKIVPHFFNVDFYGVSIKPEQESGFEVYAAANLSGLCLQF